jgi:squalene cyclase
VIEQISGQPHFARSHPGSELQRQASALDSTLSRLLETQGDGGGWPAAPTLPITTESTALGLLAVSFATGESSRVATTRARTWLQARQRPDGSWPHSDQVPHGDWATSLAVLALSRFPDDSTSADAGAQWLLGQEGRTYGWLTKLIFLLFPEREAVKLDPDLTGWPWYPGTFSWIEPTSYSLVALKSRREDLHGRRARARIDEAERMVMDRECLSGGWNYGNSRVLDEELWPYPDTTALALIALQDYPQPESLERSLTVLKEMIEDRASVLSLALAVLALQLHGRDVSALRSRLAGRVQSELLPTDTRSLAFAALALGDGAMPLAVPPDPLRLARSADG